MIVSRDGPVVFFYAGTGDQARKAHKLIHSLASEHGWRVESQLERWHAVAERWEDPDTAIPSSASARRAEHAELIQQEREQSQAEGFPAWEVRVRCESHRDAKQLAEQLAAEGIPSVRRWRYLLVGALDEDSAAQLADRIQREAPAGVTTKVEGSARAILATASQVAGANPFVVY